MLPYRPFLLPAARALAVLTAAALAVSWLIARWVFVLPVFRAEALALSALENPKFRVRMSTMIERLRKTESRQ
jgi:hypothetical protein